MAHWPYGKWLAEWCANKCKIMARHLHSHSHRHSHSHSHSHRHSRPLSGKVQRGQCQCRRAFGAFSGFTFAISKGKCLPIRAVAVSWIYSLEIAELELLAFGKMINIARIKSVNKQLIRTYLHKGQHFKSPITMFSL